MRKLRIFIVELLLAAALVGWLLVKSPDYFDSLMPWIVAAIVWHLFYECLWQSDWAKRLRDRWLPSSTSNWTIFLVLSAVICIPSWFATRYWVQKITAHTQPVSQPIAPLPPTTNPNTGTIIQQQSDHGKCTNIVGGHDVTVTCPETTDDKSKK
jgi:hypothetical protein